MRTLVIDTAFKAGRVGLTVDGAVTAEENIDPGHLESRTFAALMKIGVRPNLDNIDLIALAAGPGSFTGLKIGAVVAKSLSYLQKKPFKAVGTLPWLAVSGGQGLMLPYMRSHADRFYWGLYEVRRDNSSIGVPREIIGPKCTDADAVAGALEAAGLAEPGTIVGLAGDDAELNIGWAKTKVNLELSILARLAEYGLETEGPDDPLSFAPIYVARSQAEEKAEGDE